MTRQCIIRILDEVNCVLVGLHPDDLLYFYELFGVFAPNYFFQPKFKLGTWDGKIRYFHKTGKTFVYLLEEIVPKVLKLGYKIKVNDLRPKLYLSAPHPELIGPDFFAKLGVINPKTNELWDVRPYQVDMVNVLLKNGNGIGVAGTGSGKTSMTAAIALSYEFMYDYKSIIIVPDKNLTVQTRNNYKHFTVDVGEYSGDNKDLNHKHIVSTWQALQNNPKIIQSFQVLIVDEAHGLTGKVLNNIVNVYGKNIQFRFGVTGTLPKEAADIMAIRASVGPERCNIPAHQLIDEGFLAKIHINIFQHDIDLTSQYQTYKEETTDIIPLTYAKFKSEYFGEWGNEKSFLQHDKDRLQWMADTIQLKRSKEKGNCLCLVNGVAYGRKLAKMIPGAHFINKDSKMEARQEIYDLFQTNNDIVVIATARIAGTGLDIDRIFYIFLIDIGKSFIRTIQSIGRGLRKAIDKQKVNVFDIGANTKYSSKHLRDRIAYYKEAKYPHSLHKFKIQ